MIAVMGAAGNVGSKVAGLLLGQGRPVRVLEHRRSLEELGRRGAEVVTGDLTDPASLGVLLKDAEAALVMLPDVVADPEFVATRSRMSRTIADTLGESGVGHVVALSTVAAGQPDATGPAAGLRELEQRLSALDGLSVLLLRSPFYMENLLASLPLVQAQGINATAIDGDLGLPMTATRDVAAEAAERLARRDFHGHRARLLVGPEDVALRAATRALGERLGRPDARYLQLPPDDVRGALVGAGMSESGASAMVELQLGLNRQGRSPPCARPPTSPPPPGSGSFSPRCSGEGVPGAARPLPGRAAPPGRGGLRRGPPRLERGHRPAPGPDHPLRRG